MCTLVSGNKGSSQKKSESSLQSLCQKGHWRGISLLLRPWRRARKW